MKVRWSHSTTMEMVFFKSPVYVYCFTHLHFTNRFYVELTFALLWVQRRGARMALKRWQEVTRSAHIRAPIKSGMCWSSTFQRKRKSWSGGGIVHVLIATQVEDLLFKSSANLTACFSHGFQKQNENEKNPQTWTKTISSRNLTGKKIINGSWFLFVRLYVYSARVVSIFLQNSAKDKTALKSCNKWSTLCCLRVKKKI